MYARDLVGCVPQVVTLSTASQIILRDYPQRRKVVISNASGIGVWLARSQTAIVGSGIYLAPNGTVLVDEPDVYGSIYRGPWSAIAVSGSPTIGISEDR